MTGMTLRQALHTSAAKTLPRATAEQHNSSNTVSKRSTNNRRKNFSKALTTRATNRWAAQRQCNFLNPWIPNHRTTLQQKCCQPTDPVRHTTSSTTTRNLEINTHIVLTLPKLLLPLCKQSAVDVSTDGQFFIDTVTTPTAAYRTNKTTNTK